MKAAMLKGPGEITLEEIDIPTISDTEVLVEVKYCGICGTDLASFRDPSLLTEGTFLGHEISGIIARVGKEVETLKPGNRVVIFPNHYCGECWACKQGFFSCCQHYLDTSPGTLADSSTPGGFTKFVRITNPKQRIFILPDRVSFEEGALVEPLATPVHAIKLSALKQGDRTMVLGAGPVGLGVIAFLKNAGAGLIIAMEMNQRRIEAAKMFGADYVLDPREVSSSQERVRELTGGVGVAQVFDCSGVTQAFQSSIRFLRPRGQTILVGIIQREVPIIPFDLQLGEYQILSSWCYSSSDFGAVIDSLNKHAFPAKEMITSRIKLSEIVEKGFKKLLRPDHKEIKVLVEPD